MTDYIANHLTEGGAAARFMMEQGKDFPFKDLEDPEEQVEVDADGKPVINTNGTPKLTGASKMENAIFAEDIKHHAKAISRYKQHKEHVFQMLYSQCTEAMRAKLRTRSNWDTHTHTPDQTRSSSLRTSRPSATNMKTTTTRQWHW